MTFEFKNAMRVHRRSAHPFAEFECRLCANGFETTDAFYEHFDSEALDLRYHRFVYWVLHDVNPPAIEILVKAAEDAPADAVVAPANETQGKAAEDINGSQMPAEEGPESIDCQFCYESFDSKDSFFQHWHNGEVDIECHGHLYDLLDAYEAEEEDEDGAEDENENENENEADEAEDEDHEAEDEEDDDVNDEDGAEDENENENEDEDEPENEADEAEDEDHEAEDEEDDEVNDEDGAEDENEDEEEAENEADEAEDEDHEAEDEDDDEVKDEDEKYDDE